MEHRDAPSSSSDLTTAATRAAELLVRLREAAAEQQTIDEAVHAINRQALTYRSAELPAEPDAAALTNLEDTLRPVRGLAMSLGTAMDAAMQEEIAALESQLKAAQLNAIQHREAQNAREHPLVYAAIHTLSASAFPADVMSKIVGALDLSAVEQAHVLSVVATRQVARQSIRTDYGADTASAAVAATATEVIATTVAPAEAAVAEVPSGTFAAGAVEPDRYRNTAESIIFDNIDDLANWYQAAVRYLGTENLHLDEATNESLGETLDNLRDAIENGALDEAQKYYVELRELVGDADVALDVAYEQEFGNHPVASAKPDKAVDEAVTEATVQAPRTLQECATYVTEHRAYLTNLPVGTLDERQLSELMSHLQRAQQAIERTDMTGTQQAMADFERQFKIYFSAPEHQSPEGAVNAHDVSQAATMEVAQPTARPQGTPEVTPDGKSICRELAPDELALVEAFKVFDQQAMRQLEIALTTNNSRAFVRHLTTFVDWLTGDQKTPGTFSAIRKRMIDQVDLDLPWGASSRPRYLQYAESRQRALDRVNAQSATLGGQHRMLQLVQDLLSDIGQRLPQLFALETTFAEDADPMLQFMRDTLSKAKTVGQSPQLSTLEKIAADKAGPLGGREFGAKDVRRTTTEVSRQVVTLDAFTKSLQARIQKAASLVDSQKSDRDTAAILERRQRELFAYEHLKGILPAMDVENSVYISGIPRLKKDWFLDARYTGETPAAA